jgi:hypothetical protein
MRYTVESGNILMYSPYLYRVIDTITKKVVAMTMKEPTAQVIANTLNERGYIEE